MATRNEIYALCFFVLAPIAPSSWLIWDGLKSHKHRVDVIEQLKPYVDSVDGVAESRSSLDFADLVAKTGREDLLQGEDIFDRFSTKDLEKALAVYRGREKSKAYQAIKE